MRAMKTTKKADNQVDIDHTMQIQAYQLILPMILKQKFMRQRTGSPLKT